MPRPTVLTGIDDDFITSIRANAACTAPPGLLIIRVSSFGFALRGKRFFSIINLITGAVDFEVKSSEK
jgi:hypothetical protein